MTNNLPGVLLHAEAYPHPVSHIQLIETHISWVFLTGTYAYKVKRPVAFAFVDYTDLALRKHFCEEEVRLNRRLCKEHYLGVCPIVQEHGKLRIDGTGTAVEYAVRMLQFPEEALLLNALDEGKICSAQFEVFGVFIAEFHAKAAFVANNVNYGRPTDLRFLIDQNIGVIRQSLEEINVLNSDIDDLAQCFSKKWISVAPILETRWSANAVRELHGDLHTGNIVILEGRMIPFDCIEFNERFKWQDVLSDVAFLSMDLEVQGYEELAEAFVYGYRSASKYEFQPVVFRFLRAFRGLVRAKVSLVRAVQFSPGEKREKLLDDYKSYICYIRKLLKCE
jgi:aminoglycoside phosphotransferase family enzyme